MQNHSFRQESRSIYCSLRYEIYVVNGSFLVLHRPKPDFISMKRCDCSVLKYVSSLGFLSCELLARGRHTLALLYFV